MQLQRILLALILATVVECRGHGHGHGHHSSHHFGGHSSYGHGGSSSWISSSGGLHFDKGQNSWKGENSWSFPDVTCKDADGRELTNRLCHYSAGFPEFVDFKSACYLPYVPRQVQYGYYTARAFKEVSKEMCNNDEPFTHVPATCSATVGGREQSKSVDYVIFTKCSQSLEFQKAVDLKEKIYSVDTSLSYKESDIKEQRNLEKFFIEDRLLEYFKVIFGAIGVFLIVNWFIVAIVHYKTPAGEKTLGETTPLLSHVRGWLRLSSAVLLLIFRMSVWGFFADQDTLINFLITIFPSLLLIVWLAIILNGNHSAQKLYKAQQLYKDRLITYKNSNKGVLPGDEFSTLTNNQPWLSYELRKIQISRAAEACSLAKLAAKRRNAAHSNSGWFDEHDLGLSSDDKNAFLATNWIQKKPDGTYADYKEVFPDQNSLTEDEFNMMRATNWIQQNSRFNSDGTYADLTDDEFNMMTKTAFPDLNSLTEDEFNMMRNGNTTMSEYRRRISNLGRDINFHPIWELFCDLVFCYFAFFIFGLDADVSRAETVVELAKLEAAKTKLEAMKQKYEDEFNQLLKDYRSITA